jgi:hypothetical protein
MSLARAFLAAPLLAAVLLGPLPVAADAIIPPKVLIRKFPQGQFCALPISITFTAPSTPITVTFEAVQWMTGGTDPFTWTDQAIDNVTIATTEQVVANFDPPPPLSNSENCYIGDPSPVSYFHFNRPGLTLDLLEQFDSDPASRGWTGSAGTSFVNGRTAPRDVEIEDDVNGGCLRLGDGGGTPDPGALESASITIGGLDEGVEYDLGAWWEANFVRFPHDATYLTITIETENGTPVATKSWGTLKKGYR